MKHGWVYEIEAVAESGLVSQSASFVSVFTVLPMELRVVRKSHDLLASTPTVQKYPPLVQAHKDSSSNGIA